MEAEHAEVESEFFAGDIKLVGDLCFINHVVNAKHPSA